MFINLFIYVFILFIHSGQEASIRQAIISAPYPPTTSRPEAIRLNQNSGEKLAQVGEIALKYDLFTYLYFNYNDLEHECRQSISVKG